MERTTEAVPLNEIDVNVPGSVVTLDRAVTVSRCRYAWGAPGDYALA